MKNIKKGISIVLLPAFLVTPLVSNAQINAALDATTGVDGIITVNETEVDSTLNTEIDFESKNENDASTTSSSSVDSDLKIKLGDDDKDSDFEAEVKEVGNLLFRVNSKGVIVSTSSEVNNEEDLEVFSDNMEVKNESVSKVDFDNGNNGDVEVKVVYKHQGKFLGFIPVTIKSKTVVEASNDNETKVNSRLAWWSFLVAGENYSEEELESKIKNNTRIMASAKANVNASTKAEIAEAVIAEVVANAKAEAFVNN